MSRQKLSGKALVIQLASDQLRIAKMSLGGSEPTILSTFVADLPAGAVTDGVIHQTQTVRDALQGALQTPELRRVKRVIFSLCTTQVIAEQASVPSVPLNKLDKMLESNMDMYFPVDTQNYHLTWQVTEKKNERGEMSLQLWAVSTSLVTPYYDLANSCGLSVLAIDYCGHALASAVNASFAVPAGGKKAPKKAMALSLGKKGDQSEEDSLTDEAQSPSDTSSPTELYLMAEEEHLLMLFVKDDQVKLQRMFLCGPHMESELGEVVMALDYYDSMEMGAYGSVHCTLCGALAADEQFVALAREVLNIPVSVLPSLDGPQWTLCLGAACTDLDFGIPALNKPGGAGQINNAWQYGLILVGGIALALALVTTMGSKTVWNTTIAGLESTKNTLQIQAAQNANYAQNYKDYKSAYDTYSSIWDTLHSPTTLRTYNDNLVLMIDELESVLPKDTSVTRIEIADDGLAVSLASPSKEQAAYTIKSLRGLQYADFVTVSSLMQYSNPTYPEDPGSPYDPTLPYDPHNYNFIEAYQRLFGSYEPAPTVGSGEYDVLLNILIQSSKNNNGEANIEDLIQSAIDSGLITEEEIKDLLNGETELDTEQLLEDLMASGEFSADKIAQSMFELTPDEFNALEDAYAAVPDLDLDLDLDELLEDASFRERKDALSFMLNNDPIAMYRFFNLFKVDMNRPASACVLDTKIYDGIWENADLLFPLMSGDMSQAQGSIPVLVELLIQDEDCLSSTEKLMREDERLEARYAFYLALEMDEISLDDIELPVIDPEEILKDYITGDLPDVENKEDLEGALDTILPDLDIDLDDILKPDSDNKNDKDDKDDKDDKGDKDDKDNSSKPSLEDILAGLVGDKDDSSSGSSGSSGSTGSSGSDELPSWIFDIIGGNTGTGGSVAPQQPVDERYHYKIALSYKDALILAEQERKGLVGADKVAELEVDA